MKAWHRRVVGYGTAVAICGGLVYGGFVRRTDPDLLTMVSSVDVQLRLAAGMPELDKAGHPLAAREQMLAAARDYLAKIDRADPDFTPAIEYRAFLAYIDKDYRGAAAGYRRLRQQRDCAEEMRDMALVNEARMLRMAGQPAAAVELLRAHGGQLSAASAEMARRELTQLQNATESIGSAGQAAAAASPAASGH